MLKENTLAIIQEAWESLEKHVKHPIAGEFARALIEGREAPSAR
jgi:hypothetical protein